MSRDPGTDREIPAQAYRDAALELFHSPGEIEIDDPADHDLEAMISRGADQGAYVRAWVWVSREDAEKASGAHV